MKINLKNKKKTQKAKAMKKIKSTIDFLDIETINENFITLKDGKKKLVVCGIKIEPHSIFLDSYEEQKRRVHRLRSALNNIDFDMWHGFVFNPVNLDQYLNQLVHQMAYEEDEVIKEMIEDDIEKAQAFMMSYRELEFFIMIRGKAGRKFDERFMQLQSSIKNAGFSFKVLNRLDFDNYLSYSFENDLVNDFYFSRSVFNDELDVQMEEEEDDDDEY